MKYVNTLISCVNEPINCEITEELIKTQLIIMKWQ